MKTLTPRQRHRRQAVGQRLRQRQAAQQRFREPPTPKRAAHIASREAGLEFNPVIRQARSEAKGSQNREKQISDWYSQLGATYAQGQQQAADAYKAAEEETNKRLAEAGQRGNEAVKGLQGEDQAFAQLVGGPQDTQGIAKAASAQQAAERQAATLTSPLTAQGADYVASLGSRRAAAGMRGIEAHREESERRQGITQDLAKAKRERGAATGVNLEKLREGARDYAVQQAAFGQKKLEAGVDARQAAARIGVERANAATSARNAATSERSQSTTAHHYRTEAQQARRKERFEQNHQGLTPSEQRSAREGRRNAVATARSLFESKEWPSWQALERAVRKEGEVSPADARRAVARLRQHVEGQQQASSPPRRPGFNP